MAENITVVMSKGDLQPLANNIKTLNGLSQSDLVTLNEMEKAIEDANDAVDSQENLIAQISAALEGKAAGGGGSGTVETCTVKITNSYGYYISSWIATAYRNNMLCAVSSEMYDNSSSAPTEVIIENVVCNSGLYFSTTALGSIVYDVSNGSIIFQKGGMVYAQTPSEAGSTMIINIYSND